jgi:tetratricopeptide (TPR) repeat protein
MAIDKSRTSPMMKLGISVLIVAVALGVIGIPMVSALSECSSQTPNNQQASQTASVTVEAIAAQHTPVVQATEASLTVQPKDYTLLVQQGNNYFEWASAVMQALSGKGTSEALPIWIAASSYYDRALKVKAGDANVMTDYSVTLYHSNQLAAAIKLGEQVVAKDPKFAPVRFNLGLYYESAQDKVKAKAAFQAYLQLAPNGPNVDTAKAHLKTL